MLFTALTSPPREMLPPDATIVMSSRASSILDPVTLSELSTATLPASPANNDTILFMPCSNFSTYNLVVARNGNNIQRIAQDMTVATNYAAFHLTYVTSYGWIMW